MAIEIRKIVIRNFKNLKDVVIYPKKFNVFIGPNGSGKTNFLEFFKLLRKIYVERNPYPFLEWDGYENVVWNHQRSLPIEFEIETVERTSLAEFLRKYLRKYRRIRDIEFKKDIQFNVFRRISASFWADRAENLKILREGFEIKIPELNCLFSIEKIGNEWKVIIDGKSCYLKSSIDSLFFIISAIVEEGLRFYDEAEAYIHDFTRDMIADEIVFDLPEDFKKNFKLKLLKLNLIEEDPKKEFSSWSLSMYISEILATIYFPLLTIFKTIVLFPLNMIDIKQKRKIIPRDEPLNDRGENALDILALTQLKENRLPERIEYALENYFNGRGYFRNTNLYLYDLNKKTEYSKEHLPDGLLKLLVILTALEQNPSILLIDEIENSLHPELLEFLINSLKECEGCVFVTTHSPVVLNLVDPEEIFIFKPKDDGSIEIKNVTEYKSKEELMKELEELGISLGEKVLYGLT